MLQGLLYVDFPKKKGQHQGSAGPRGSYFEGKALRDLAGPMLLRPQHYRAEVTVTSQLYEFSIIDPSRAFKFMARPWRTSRPRTQKIMSSAMLVA